MRKKIKETGFALFFIGVIALVAVEASEAATVPERGAQVANPMAVPATVVFRD